MIIPYSQLINSWHLKASDEDYFSKFVFEYMAFNAFLMKIKYVDSRSDRHAIQRLKRDENVKSDYLNLMLNISGPTRSWVIIQKELNRAPLGNTSRRGEGVEELAWWNCSYDANNQKKEEDNKKPIGVLHDHHDWENMVEFWYAIRNNLFHGTKDPQNARDQLLVEHGYKTLRTLMDMFISDRSLGSR